jgi:hypothetical protein
MMNERKQQVEKEISSILAHYSQRGRNLFAYTSSGECVGRAGNSWAAAFWAGYDGQTWGARVPARNAISRPWYTAGKRAAKTEQMKNANEQS